MVEDKEDMSREPDFALNLARDLATLEQDEFVRDALGTTTSLREYSKQVEKDLREVEAESVRDYVRQSSQVADLHTEMTKCDSILGKMQEMLLGFESDLGSVAFEIRQLRSESRRMSTKLKNRRAAEAKLTAFLESLAFSPSMPKILCEGAVDDDFLDQIQTLDARLTFAKMTTGSSNRRSVKEVSPLLEKLKVKACARARDYLIETVGELRKLQTNVVVVQRSQLGRFSGLYSFLQRYSSESATEVRDFYVDSMSRALHSLFKTYNAALVKFDLEVANKHDLVAVDESSVRSSFTSRVSLTKRGDGFSLGDRVDVLSRLEAPPIIVHVAQAEDKLYPFEELFRSAARHLIDAVASENEFVQIFFFGNQPQQKQQVDSLVSKIFGKAASAALEHLENKLFQCYDVVGLLLVARIVTASREAARRVGGGGGVLLSHFLDHCDSLLRPRLDAILTANVESVKRADPARLGLNGVVMPHYATRRFAELAAAVYVLFPSDDAGPHALASRRSIAELRTQIVDLLRRLASSFKDKDRIVFLVNNYDLILTIFRERRVRSDDATLFETKLKKERELFVEYELQSYFSKMIQFVNRTEKMNPPSKPSAAAAAAAATGNSPPGSNAAAATIQVDTATVERLVRDFAASWKTAIDKIHRDILAYFANFVNGMEVLKQVLTQLLLYYTRFQKIVHRAWRRPPAFASDLVPTAVILDEIKQYSHSF